MTTYELSALKHKITEDTERLSLIKDQIADLDRKISDCDEQLSRKQKDIPWKFIVLTGIFLLSGTVTFICGLHIVGIILVVLAVYFGSRLLSERSFDRKFYKRTQCRRDEYSARRAALSAQSKELAENVAAAKAKAAAEER